MGKYHGTRVTGSGIKPGNRSGAKASGTTSYPHGKVQKSVPAATNKGDRVIVPDPDTKTVRY